MGATCTCGCCNHSKPMRTPFSRVEVVPYWAPKSGGWKSKWLLDGCCLTDPPKKGVLHIANSKDHSKLIVFSFPPLHLRSCSLIFIVRVCNSFSLIAHFTFFFRCRAFYKATQSRHDVILFLLSRCVISFCSLFLTKWHNMTSQKYYRVWRLFPVHTLPETQEIGQLTTYTNII